MTRSRITSKTLEPGHRFTIAGNGIGEQGQVVVGGCDVKTGQPCKVVTLTVYRVAHRISDHEVGITPALLP